MCTLCAKYVHKIWQVLIFRAAIFEFKMAARLDTMLIANGTKLHMNMHIVKCMRVNFGALVIYISFEICRIIDIHGGHF